MAAIFAGAGGARVILLETTRDGGRKILISGGGRCNVMPSALKPEQYVTASSPNTLKKILLSWPLAEQRSFFEEELGVPLALEPETGKLFPVSNRARDVRDALLARVRDAGGEIWFEARVVELEPVDRGGWEVRLADGRVLDAGAVVLATGGLSVPQTGSDGRGLALVRALGPHRSRYLSRADSPHLRASRHAALAGVSLEVELSAPVERARFVTRGGFLFTHRGYSGPSVLNVSHLAVLSRLRGEAPQRIEVSWTDLDRKGWEALFRESPGSTAGSLLRRRLPDRLADTLLTESAVDGGRPLSQLRRDERLRLLDVLTTYSLPWTGDEGYKKAEVTGGGVALAEVTPVPWRAVFTPGSTCAARFSMPSDPSAGTTSPGRGPPAVPRAARPPPPLPDPATIPGAPEWIPFSADIRS
jgi:predicted Rossmann fold flavoprotein